MSTVYGKRVHDSVPNFIGKDWRARQGAAVAHRAREEALRPRRAAISTLIDAHKERTFRAGVLESMTAERNAVMAQIAATEAQLAQLRAEALPAAERAVEAAQARVDALASDLDHARKVLEAENVVAATEPAR